MADPLSSERLAVMHTYWRPVEHCAERLSSRHALAATPIFARRFVPGNVALKMTLDASALAHDASILPPENAA